MVQINGSDWALEVHQKCSVCRKRRASALHKCCHRYLCDECHMQQCAIALKQAEIDRLRRLIYKLHVALNEVMAGETLSLERKESLDEQVSCSLPMNEGVNL